MDDTYDINISEFVEIRPEEADALIDLLFQQEKLKAQQRIVTIVRERSPLPLHNPSQLSVYEDDFLRRELFIADVAKRLTLDGTVHTLDYIRRTFRFSRKIAHAIVREAQQEIHSKLQGETDLARSVAINRLESIMRRAKDACDLSNEIKAFKEYARILGIYPTEEGGLGDLAKVLRTIARSEGPDPTQVVEMTDDKEEGQELIEWSAPEQFEELEETISDD